MLILVSVVTGCVSISAFALLVYVLTGTISSLVVIKICAITAGKKVSVNYKEKEEEAW